MNAHQGEYYVLDASAEGGKRYLQVNGKPYMYKDSQEEVSLVELKASGESIRFDEATG